MCFECRHEALEVFLFIAALIWMGLLAYAQIWRHSPTCLYGARTDEIPKGPSTSGPHSASVDIQEPKAETMSPLLDSMPGEASAPLVSHCIEEKENKVHSLVELIKVRLDLAVSDLLQHILRRSG